MGSKPYRIVYIMSNGHSGSTLLDIVLGSQERAFSGGELTFVGREGLEEELCSCGERIGTCPFWVEVSRLWRAQGAPDLPTYRRLRHRYERNKVFARALVRGFVQPSPGYLAYCAATEALFDAIHDVSGADVIIDSSKTPARVPVLTRFADVSVIHLCREFQGVLNSAQRAIAKDISKGVERAYHPRPPSRVLLEWLSTNVLSEVFTLHAAKRRLHYAKFVQSPEEALASLGDDAPVGVARRSFAAEHMLAGNKLRLKRDISIDTKLGFTYDQLTRGQALVASSVDGLFPRWSGGQ